MFCDPNDPGKNGEADADDGSDSQGETDDGREDLVYGLRESDFDDLEER